MVKYDEKIAKAAMMSSAELMAEVTRRVRERGIVLPEDKAQKVKAVAVLVLEIMNERYSAEEARRAALT